ncbi:MAG: VIT1/CCC1 transporter family protein [Ferrimicrobium sp.]
MEIHRHINHRDVTGGGARASVFGISDGLVSNVALILGLAGAHTGQRAVILAGIAGLLAGACSMAVGEFLSMRAQRELLERELRIEAIELREHPNEELQELASSYRSRGVPQDLAEQVSQYLMADSTIALEVHAIEELGVGPDAMGSPLQAAGASFVSFTIGALIPLVAWFYLVGNSAVLASVLISAAASFAIGGILSHLTDRPVIRGALFQLVLSAGAASTTFFVGHLIGGAIH